MKGISRIAKKCAEMTDKMENKYKEVGNVCIDHSLDAVDEAQKHRNQKYNCEDTDSDNAVKLIVL